MENLVHAAARDARAWSTGWQHGDPALDCERRARRL